MTEARILVACDDDADASVVTKLLRAEFADVALSSAVDRAAADFDAHRPGVVVLAFNAIDKAERYCVGLPRPGTAAPAALYRTIVLCSKDDLQRAYELCKDSHFDDYVLFWPANHDAPRLPMSVHRALRELSRTTGPGADEIAAHARGAAALAPLIDEHAARAVEHVQRADASLADARASIGAALDGLAHADGPAALEQAIARVKREDVEPRLLAVAAAIRPVRALADTLKRDAAPGLSAARTLTALAKRARPLVVVVDDDEFQRRMIERMLETADVDTALAATGAEALALLRRRRPDLVLMDVNLPDMTGLEATRRLKTIDRFASIPVVMLTGQSAREVVLDSVHVGAAGFLVKPVEKAALVAKVRKLLPA